jgi:hypothetical protein
MRLDVSSAVAVNRNGRRSYGTTRWIDGSRLSFSTHADVEPGEKLELRLALDGRYETVCAEVQIDHTRRPALGGPLVCDARLVYVPASDRRLLDDWIAERSASISRSRERAASDRWSETLSAAATALAANGTPGAASGEASDIATDISHAPVAEHADMPHGRALIGAALRVSLARARRARPERRIRQAAALAPAVVLSRDGATVSVTWATWQGVARAWEGDLGKGWMDIPSAELAPPAGLHLTMRLCLPDGEVLPLMGEVVAETLHGFSVAVQLTPTARARMQKAVLGW